ncbi:hypothetical protein HMF8227_02360 [Saliniradius amylolyticus]|uniref:Uncharacterized protein n=1 Tax=Saliniradius amylolyticus TaxID=2183582 RepID=A0A2S2E5J8_9ALTE|nr:hypothetical protein [Saliniradius amylolyticus]AWL12812.1 hypothetical protein HMF8227_02360 [Saliniradius amylolyticus]
MSVNSQLADYQTRLDAALMPVVTRDWKPRSAFKNDDLKPGHYTLVYRGEKSPEPHQTYIQFLMIGRIYCGKDATGEQIEQAELNLLQAFKDFVFTSAPEIEIGSVACSHQQEHPDGWFVAECSAGPFDFQHNQDWLGDETDIDGIKASRAPDIGLEHEEDYVSLPTLEESDG